MLGATANAAPYVHRARLIRIEHRNATITVKRSRRAVGSFEGVLTARHLRSYKVGVPFVAYVLSYFD